MTMKGKLATSAGLLVCLFLVLACGQQTTPPQTSATQKKGQIVQPEVKPGKNADASSLLISFHGCADLLLSDTRGRKLGYDAALKKSYQQIPGGIYDEGDLLSDDEDDGGTSKSGAKPTTANQDCASDKTLQVPQPLAGNYRLSIDNATRKPFTLEITSYGPDSKQNGHFVLKPPQGTSSGGAIYQFQIPPSPEGLLKVKPVAMLDQPSQLELFWKIN
jgi:hypothetical protein